jgi:hypothetical protein
MTMGCYGIHFDRTNTWFEQGRAWIQYLTRCQYLLQKGLSVADLLYFEGENAPVEAPAPATLTPPPPTGYDWDLIDSGALLERARAADGRIVLPDGMSYRVLILRADARLSLPVMRKIRDLVRQGAKPQGSPSLMGYPESDSEVRRIADELWGESAGADAVERTVGGGRVFCGQPLPEVLAKLGVTPDIEITSRSGTEQVYAIHRRIGDADVYFLCNHKRREEELVGSGDGRNCRIRGLRFGWRQRKGAGPSGSSGVAVRSVPIAGGGQPGCFGHAGQDSRASNEPVRNSFGGAASRRGQ